ncbi:3-deoxy-manno-octulosonate cytidylyltransferase [uncultured Lentibacter sp.]|mgnify:CR=1 FL=1|uniref:3-deoxy-manno-octulosonate cytidylyltransferase n=1 Tax=uncultured Lentibacter sp. TaxID=1659309 RepID=UPI002624460B|nr:3-deoxy-manno-octulosonate cytidylyltransferase [uncultured Lentibacter sp.]MCW1954952.1 3-deoxy-manno-octulosonate cytidylyltransferase [Roseobacter sp.]
MTDYAVVIPARLGSSRLARKPLLEIGGKPMIIHTWERGIEAAPAERVYVATDSQEIFDVCAQYGAQAVMTDVACLTGTDRIASLTQTLPRDVYINLQGDEPMMPSANIRKIIEASLAAPDKIINGWAFITEEDEFRSRTIPKVVIREDGQLMYMSRASIPGTKSDEFIFSRKQICVYGFPRAALQAFAARTEKTAHEEAEDIEILRFVEMGWDVTMIELSGASIAVDTPDDLERVRAKMLKP